MFCLLWLAFRSLVRLFRDRRDLILANIVLRQQLVMQKRRHPRPALHLFDKVFRVTVGRLWSQWKQSLIVVTPETVIRWHRADFHMYQRPISRVRQPIRASQLASQPKQLAGEQGEDRPKTVQESCVTPRFRPRSTCTRSKTATKHARRRGISDGARSQYEYGAVTCGLDCGLRFLGQHSVSR